MQQRVLGFLLFCGFIATSVACRAQAPASWVSGQVLCADGNTAARQAKVEFVPLGKLVLGAVLQLAAETQSAETDFNGIYEVALAPGTYVVNAFLPGYLN